MAVETPIEDLAKILGDNNTLVHKWGTQLLALADYSTPMPGKFFDTATGKPLTLPEGFKILGYITTDGQQSSRSIESSDTNMVQDLEPVRTDMTGRTRTLHVNFGESNAWVKGLAHGKPVSAWPSAKDADWEYTDGEVTDMPYYRLLTIAQDGVGDDATYRIQAGYRVKVTDQGDQTLNRSDVEVEDTTFGFYKDPASGKTFTEAQSKAKKSGQMSAATDKPTKGGSE